MLPLFELLSPLVLLSLLGGVTSGVDGVGFSGVLGISGVSGVSGISGTAGVSMLSESSGNKSPSGTCAVEHAAMVLRDKAIAKNVAGKNLFFIIFSPKHKLEKGEEKSFNATMPPSFLSTIIKQAQTKRQ